MCAHSSVLVLPTERQTDDSPAVVVPSSRSEPSSTTYARLNHLSCGLQRSLALAGVTRGSRVALVLPNGLEFVVALLAVVRQRAVAAPVSPQLKQDEYRQVLGSIRPALVVVAARAAGAPAGAADAAEPAALVAAELGLPAASCRAGHDGVHLERRGGPSSGKPARVFSPHEVEAEDGALLLLTSGTTGPPKKVMLSHTNLLVAMRIIASAHALSSLDRCLIITPLFHIIGVGGSLLTTLFTGGCVVIPPSLSGSLWKTCEEFKITWFHAVPTLYRLIIAFPLPDGRFPPALRFLRSGGSDMAPDLYARLRELGPPILEVYGMTETAPAIFCNRLDPAGGEGTRLGHYPIAEAVDVMILPHLPATEDDQDQDQDQDAGRHNGPGTGPSSPDDPVLRLTKTPGVAGEICVRGRSVTAGYVDNPEANEEAFLSNGFFRTGDLGVLHPDGYLQLVGRLKEVINKGGEKVSPSEIEHLILSHEAVKEAACFRVADDVYGEEIGKYHPECSIEPRRGKSRITWLILSSHGTPHDRPGRRSSRRKGVQGCRAQKARSSECCPVQSPQSGTSVSRYCGCMFTIQYRNCAVTHMGTCGALRSSSSIQFQPTKPESR